MADSYFDPSFDLGPVCVYEAEGVLSDLSPVNSEKISLAAYPYMRKRRISGWMSVTGTG